MIQSMTAFSRVSDQGDWGMATWEIRAVNHRYLECSFKIPELLRPLESELRVAVQQQLHRGKVECILKFQPGEKSGIDFVLNTSLVQKLNNAIKALQKEMTLGEAIDPMKILAWPQVLQIAEDNIAEIGSIITNLFNKALVDLVTARKREGAALQGYLEKNLDSIFELSSKIKQKLPQIVQNQKAKILTKLAELKLELDSMRVEQEMIFFVQKIDVAEELARLETHATEIQRLLKEGSNVGKRLEFLLQELNREANTLAAKSVDAKITGFAVELKVLIEQLREQAQNIV